MRALSNRFAARRRLLSARIDASRASLRTSNGVAPPRRLREFFHEEVE
jgi:hypothetical protein